MNFQKQLLVAFIFIFYSHAAFSWNTPALNTPAAGATTWVGVTLDWGAVANSQQCQVEVDLSATFNTPGLMSFTRNYINSNSGNTDTEHYLTLYTESFRAKPGLNTFECVPPSNTRKGNYIVQIAVKGKNIASAKALRK